MIAAAEIARLLADRTDQLVADLLPGGVREGRQWRCGSVAGEPGTSLCVELAGPKRGIWFDHANPEHRGDLLDLVRCCHGWSLPEAKAWAERWLGIEPGEAERPRRPASAPIAAPDKPVTWPRIWRNAFPISGTLAEIYLAARGVSYHDPAGEALRFAPHRARLHPATDTLEHHPALLGLLRDIGTGEPCGIVNIYLRPDGADRLRDKKGKTNTGRAGGAAVMLGCDFEDVTGGLGVAEGIETALAMLADGVCPIWALCGTGNLSAFPLLGGIEALAIGADTGAPGQNAAREVAARWRRAGRLVRTITPQSDDWAANRKAAS